MIKLQHIFRLETLGNKVRALFAVVLMIGMTLFIVSFIDALSMYQDWQDERQKSLNKSVNQWLNSYQQDLNYAHLALKPKKSILAEHIEDDHHRAIQILLDEVRELHSLDSIFINIENEVLLNYDKEIRGQLKIEKLALLDKATSNAELTLLDHREIFLVGDEMQQTGLIVAMKIPIYFDIGDLAAELSLVKLIRTVDAKQGKRQWLSEDARIVFSNSSEPLFKVSEQRAWSVFFEKENTVQISVSELEGMVDLGYFYITEPNAVIRNAVFKTLAYSLLPLIILALVIWIIYRFVQRNVVYPVAEMSEVANKFTEGLSDQRLQFMEEKALSQWTEVDRLGSGFNKLLDVLDKRQRKLARLNSALENKVEARTRELQKTNLSLKKLARTDALTEVGNRHAFDELWEAMTDNFVSGNIETAIVAIIDCDYFKSINDDYGHYIGDQILVSIAHKIRNHVQDSGSLVRLGGDEFAVLYDAVEIDLALSQMEALSQDVRTIEPERLGIKEPLSISVGISATSDHEDIQVFDLMKQADAAMYLAKQSLSNKVVLFDSQQHALTAEALSHEKTTLVLNAIEKGEGLTLLYQPVYSTKTGQVDYFEVLSRIDVDGKFLSPGVFLPVVQRIKKAVEFDQAVVKKVLQSLQAGTVKSGVGVSINISAESLATKDVCEWFKPLVPFLDSHPIIVEITETTLIQHLEEASGYIEEFREAGFGVALDDFGSGYSSISYLAKLPVDIIKLDISLAKVICNKETSAKLILGLVEELSQIGYKIVIEGVEEQEMFDVLVETAATHLQGYYINRPAQQPSENVSHVSRSY